MGHYKSECPKLSAKEKEELKERRDTPRRSLVASESTSKQSDEEESDSDAFTEPDLGEDVDLGLMALTDAETGEASVVDPMPKRDLQAIWYLDNGCSRHMTGVKSLFQNYVEKRGPQVTFGDNSKGVTKGYSVLKIGMMSIENVSYAEGLKHNLLSISQFCDKGYCMEFIANKCIVKNKLTSQITLTRE